MRVLYAVLLFLALPSPLLAQSAGTLLLTGEASSVAVDGPVTTWTFANGWEWSFDSSRDYRLCDVVQFKGGQNEALCYATVGNPPRSQMTFRAWEQDGVFFVDHNVRGLWPAELRKCLIRSPYNEANAPGGRLVYSLWFYSPGQYDIDSSGVPQFW